MTRATMPDLPSKAWLVWGVKSSFLRYVSKLPRSEASVGGGAGLTPSKEFTFPRSDEQETPGEDASMSFMGDLSIVAHGGVLNFVIADARIDFDDAGGVLSAFTRSSPDERMRIASLERFDEESEDGSIAASYRASLLEEACESFNNVYPDGTALDPVRLVAPTE